MTASTERLDWSWFSPPVHRQFRWREKEEGRKRDDRSRIMKNNILHRSVSKKILFPEREETNPSSPHLRWNVCRKVGDNPIVEGLTIGLTSHRPLFPYAEGNKGKRRAHHRVILAKPRPIVDRSALAVRSKHCERRPLPLTSSKKRQVLDPTLSKKEASPTKKRSNLFLFFSSTSVKWVGEYYF